MSRLLYSVTSVSHDLRWSASSFSNIRRTTNHATVFVLPTFSEVSPSILRKRIHWKLSFSHCVENDGENAPKTNTSTERVLRKAPGRVKIKLRATWKCEIVLCWLQGFEFPGSRQEKRKEKKSTSNSIATDWDLVASASFSWLRHSQVKLWLERNRNQNEGLGKIYRTNVQADLIVLALVVQW